ncbi:hypothetical protein, partial [Bacillus velezensis]|uniref:hypothetical protein n=1 Tax=Bacillus velezensis TaxID=492670 RepID=UPI001A8EE3DE
RGSGRSKKKGNPAGGKERGGRTGQKGPQRWIKKEGGKGGKRKRRKEGSQTGRKRSKVRGGEDVMKRGAKPGRYSGYNHKTL